MTPRPPIPDRIRLFALFSALRRIGTASFRFPSSSGDVAVELTASLDQVIQVLSRDLRSHLNISDRIRLCCVQKPEPTQVKASAQSFNAV